MESEETFYAVGHGIGDTDTQTLAEPVSEPVEPANEPISEPEIKPTAKSTKKKSAKKETETVTLVAAIGLTKTAILINKKWRAYRDLLSALLVNGKRYAEKEIDEIINKFLRRT